MKLDIRDFLENLLGKFEFQSNPTKITDALREDVSKILTIYR